MFKQVPVVAVMTRGGGTRAPTSLLGNLLGFQKLNLLDTLLGHLVQHGKEILNKGIICHFCSLLSEGFLFWSQAFLLFH